MNFFYYLKIICLLYLVSLLVSISGMDFFAWLAAFSFLLYSFIPSYKNNFFLTGIDYFLAAFVLAIFISLLINSSDDWVFIAKNMDRLSWTVLLYFLVHIFYYINIVELFKGNEIKGKELISRKVIFISCIAFLVSLYGIFQFFTGIDLIRDRAPGEMHRFLNFYRSIGFFRNPMTYAHSFSMFFFLPFTCFLFLPKQQIKIKTLFFIISFVIGVSILTSQTRGAWIGLAIAIFFVSWLYSRKFFLQIFAAILSVSLTLFFMIPSLRERFLSIFDFNFNNNLQRIYLWKANFQMFLDNPVFGVGYWNNVNLLPDYYKQMGIDSDFYSHAHNTYLHFLSGTGIIGLMLYLLIMVYIFILSLRLWKYLNKFEDKNIEKNIVLAGIGAQVFLHIGGLTECNFEDGEVLQMFLVYVALVLVIWKNNWKNKELSY